ncbi:MAG: hypothetical protein LBK27_06240, partial [Treponema sp.]|nr:hypothetical protein [Treponema sp.]
FDGQENFRKIIPLRSGGSGTISLNLKHSELPFPFRLGFETLLPANIQEGADKYAVLKIIPGGIINISKLRIDQLDLGLTGNL